MIPDPITLGHVLMLAGLLAGLYGLVQLAKYLKYRSHGPGTPGYARARDGRRFASWSIAAAVALLLLGCFSPLCEVALT